MMAAEIAEEHPACQRRYDRSVRWTVSESVDCVGRERSTLRVESLRPACSLHSDSAR